MTVGTGPGRATREATGDSGQKNRGRKGTHFMKFRVLACAFGRHSVDKTNLRKTGGMHVGRCRCCHTPMEEVEPHRWGVLRVRGAGLERRGVI
ncbi:hypothetical protein SAMN06297468_2988 [Altererythrobacter xiamenensis]|uniref:Uncharacterized protein n=2 Tax=Altererythrobacter xiamenensis TaxID=1316679 RepID=A0A1Y6FM75_9SPHN|nr:hypothetical protein SAMN06297468_2988 [Altererythrobacter xiamenensis]